MRRTRSTDVGTPAATVVSVPPSTGKRGGAGGGGGTGGGAPPARWDPFPPRRLHAGAPALLDEQAHDGTLREDGPPVIEDQPFQRPGERGGTPARARPPR